MAHITLSIPDQMYEDMKRHPEIKWSEAARRGINNKLVEIKDAVKGTEILKQLPESARKDFEKLKRFSKEDWERWIKAMRAKEKKKAKYLMQMS